MTNVVRVTVEEYIDVNHCCPVCKVVVRKHNFDDFTDTFVYNRIVNKTIDETGYYSPVDHGVELFDFGEFGSVLDLKIGTKYKFHEECYNLLFKHIFQRQIDGKKLIYNGKRKNGRSFSNWP